MVRVIKAGKVGWDGLVLDIVVFTTLTNIYVPLSSSESYV
jgi:hypothetical protein